MNTYARAGKLFPGPHLYAGAGLVCLWALAGKFSIVRRFMPIYLQHDNLFDIFFFATLYFVIMLPAIPMNAVACVPQMQKGNDTARYVHIGESTLSI